MVRTRVDVARMSRSVDKAATSVPMAFNCSSSWATRCCRMSFSRLMVACVVSALGFTFLGGGALGLLRMRQPNFLARFESVIRDRPMVSAICCTLSWSCS